MSKFTLGSKVKAWGRFYDTSDTLVDPTAVYVSIRYPDKSVVNYTYGVHAELVKSGTGEYYVFISSTQTGKHYVYWKSTGTAQAADEDSFTIAGVNAS
jgi:hypothetical protein